MLVRERMKALGDHAKSSRQPPVKERKHAKAADESAAKPDAIDETILESGVTHDSAVAVLADDVTPEIAVHENGNDSAVVEIPSSEDAGELAAAASVAGEVGLQPTTDDSATQAKVVEEDDNTSAAKRAILHEWENWSALHSDELVDSNVAEYFFRHLQEKRSHLLDFVPKIERETIRSLILSRRV